jgi:beta-glucosidase
MYSNVEFIVRQCHTNGMNHDNNVNPEGAGAPVYSDVSLAVEERAADLVSRMTLPEAASQLLHASPAIPLLGIPAYNWWNEALHGIARAGTATVFPQAIALAASFDVDLVARVAGVVATEGRAKHHEAVRRGDRGIYKGLTFWSPNINIFRDPRWGRGHETYGEDPWLTGKLGSAFVLGLQAPSGRYLKAAACAKHFAVHSGPEAGRHSFDARVTAKDLRETYLPAFKSLVDAGVEAVMGAYNRTNGEACCGSQTLLARILREEWGFRGHVVSDCWAIRDFHESHGLTKDIEESAALAINAGCDLNCGCAYHGLLGAVDRGLVRDEVVRQSARRLMATRFRLGMFDPEDLVPWADTPYDLLDCEAHRQLNLEAARKALVLLRNRNSLLPLARRPGLKLAVIGPEADSRTVLLGNYHGTPSESVTALEGIRQAAGQQTRIFHAQGSHLYRNRCESLAAPGDRVAEAVSAALASDVVILCLGLDPSIEGEEGDASNEYAAGDKRNLDLPVSQQVLMDAVLKEVPDKPVILVSFTGSAMGAAWADDRLDAIVQAWYPGALGGQALGELLFGDCNPSGRLPVTFYQRDSDLPPFDDYSMKSRTYRYFEGTPLFSFGFGLSYTSFAYADLQVQVDGAGLRADPAAALVDIRANVTNTGTCRGEEVTQLYVSAPGAGEGWPLRELRGLHRQSLDPGETTELHFSLNLHDLSIILEDGSRAVRPGCYNLSLGGHQGDRCSTELAGYPVLSGSFELVGEDRALEY